MSGITPATCTPHMCTCCVSHRRRSICAQVKNEGAGVRAWQMFLHPPCLASPDQWAWGQKLLVCQCGPSLDDGHVPASLMSRLYWFTDNYIPLKLSQRGTFMTFLQTKPGLPFIPPPLHCCNEQASFHWGEPLSCLDVILRRSVSICHLPIYISCYYLLGLGLHAVSLGVLDFHRHELSAEEGSSRNHGATWWCFSSGCPIYQNPKWFQFCGTQQNEEYLMTSIFISTLCYICLPVVVFNLPWDRWEKMKHSK